MKSDAPWKTVPAPIVKYLHDAAKAAIVRADLWKAYKSHTEILTRAGLLEK